MRLLSEALIFHIGMCRTLALVVQKLTSSQRIQAHPPIARFSWRQDKNMHYCHGVASKE